MLEDEGADADGFIAEHADVADPDGVDVDGVSFNDPVASEAGGCEHADSVVPAGVAAVATGIARRGESTGKDGGGESTRSSDDGFGGTDRGGNGGSCERGKWCAGGGVDGHGATGICSCACTCTGAGGNEYIDHGRDGLSGGPAAQPMLIGT